MIPRVLHHIWINAADPSLPPPFSTYRDGWRALHPDWTLRLWNLDNIDFPLVRPELLPLCANYAQMANVLRLEVLHRHGGVVVAGDPTVTPLQDKDFSALPPTVAIAAECDPLADDAAAYAAAIRAAGGRAHAVTAKGMVHGYLRARATVPRAAQSFAFICSAISALARGEWPYGDAK